MILSNFNIIQLALQNGWYHGPYHNHFGSFLTCLNNVCLHINDNRRLYKIMSFLHVRDALIERLLHFQMVQQHKVNSKFES